MRPVVQPSLALAWLVAVAAIMAVCVLALWADWRFADMPRLPMQFGLDGSVNGTAPRRIGLAVAPLLGGAFMLAALVQRSFDGDGASALRHAALIGAVLIAVELFHLYLVLRHVAAR